MKKNLSILLLSALFLLLFGTVNPIEADAATKIDSGKWYFGCTDGTTDQTYTYNMQESGYFYYQVIPYEDKYIFEGEEVSDDTYKIYTSMVSKYKTYIDDAHVYHEDGGYTSPKFSFRKGQKITFNVTDAKDYKTKFKIKVVFKKVKNFEKEPNNTKRKATKIKAKKSYTGFVMDGEEDWFVFKVPKTKRYTVSTVSLTDNYREDIEIYVGYKKVNSTVMYGGEGWKKVYTAKLKKGQKIFIKISHGGEDEMYKVKVR